MEKSRVESEWKEDIEVFRLANRKDSRVVIQRADRESIRMMKEDLSFSSCKLTLYDSYGRRFGMGRVRDRGEHEKMSGRNVDTDGHFQMHV